MDEIKYIKLKTEDYLLIGRRDAWIKDLNFLNIINEIIELYKDSENILKIIRNYILGYKIGKLELLLSKFEDIVCFDFETQEFCKLNEKGIISISFKSGYNNFKKEASRNAKKILELN